MSPTKKYKAKINDKLTNDELLRSTKGVEDSTSMNKLELKTLLSIISSQELTPSYSVSPSLPKGRLEKC